MRVVEPIAQSLGVPDALDGKPDDLRVELAVADQVEPAAVLGQGVGIELVHLPLGDDGVWPSYGAGSPCECCPLDATTYDPRTQAVIVIRWGDDQQAPFIVSGQPTLPEAFVRAGVDVMGGTVH